MTADKDIALIGLGVMGENLALNFASHGFAVCGFDTDPAKRLSFERRTQAKTAQAAASLKEVVAQLKSPRRLLIMVPAGRAVDAVLNELTPLLEAGDVVMDGGNTLFSDTQRRISSLQQQGILFVGVGVSGGEEGALRGPSLMLGGSAQAWPLVRTMMQAIAARADDGQPCCEWMGPGGSGHFVKMVHNGIEYADMQTICEAYWLMHQVLGMPASEIGEVFRQWNKGELGSYLIGITAEILAHHDPDTGLALVDLILDTAEQKGTGKWASQAALDMGVTAPTITNAVFARTMSALKAERITASSVLSGPKASMHTDQEGTIEKIRRALLAAKVCAYAQGFGLMRAAVREHDWPLPLAGIASVWRAGCIIRARLLEDIRRAYERQPELPNLLMDPYFAKRMSEIQQDLREVVALGALQGVPIAAFMSSLGYYDAYRSARLPANLLQAQRDYFGAHTYQRTDRPGKFHTRWVG
jgi:6-phosphogluconate dehydrogenase